MIRSWTVAAALLAWGTASAEEEPAWLKDARAQEGKLESPASIRSEDGWFTASVPFKVTDKIILDSGSYSVSFLLAPDVEADCEVYPEAPDAAGHLQAIAKAVFKEQVEKYQGKLEAKAIERAEVGAIQHDPYIQLRWIYRANAGKGARVSGFGQFVFSKQAHMISCQYVGLGYTKTFEAAVHAFAETIVFHDDKAYRPPFYTDLSVVRLGSDPVGYTILRLQRDEEGYVKASTLSAMLFQRPNGDIATRDVAHVEWTDAQGELINAVHFVTNSGDTEADLTLEQTKAGWAVSGESRGKKINATIPDPPSADSWLKQALQLRNLVKMPPGQATEISGYLWRGAEPTQFIEQRITRRANAAPGEANFQMTVAGVVLPLTVDPVSAQALKAVVPVGDKSLTAERIDVSGSY
jgi:hypothetical protein